MVGGSIALVSTLFGLASPRSALRAAEAWYESRDPKSKVGSKHHIVPKTILRRFATSAGQICVRDRFTGKTRRGAIGDLAVRDFYTFIDADNERNGVMEEWLCEIEGEFARVVQPYLDWSSFRRDRPLTPKERFVVDTFTAVQLLRGMRTRRSMELLAEFHVKVRSEDALSAQELADLQVLPHQNEHIDFLHRGSEGVAKRLAKRAAVIARFDGPALVISDEPVVFTPEDGTPEGDTRERLLVNGKRVAPDDIIQISNDVGVGLETADEVVLPLSPSHALIYFGPEVPAPAAGTVWPVSGREAVAISRELNELQARNAMGWVAGSPDGPHLAELPWPRPSRAVTIYATRSATADLVNTKAHARPRRLSR